MLLLVTGNMQKMKMLGSRGGGADPRPHGKSFMVKGFFRKTGLDPLVKQLRFQVSYCVYF